MKKVTNVSEICILIRNKLIEYGVKEHTAWYEYSTTTGLLSIFSSIKIKQSISRISFANIRNSFKNVLTRKKSLIKLIRHIYGQPPA